MAEESTRGYQSARWKRVLFLNCIVPAEEEVTRFLVCVAAGVGDPGTGLDEAGYIGLRQSQH